MISVTNLSFHYGSRTIYDNANLHIKPKDRIGLIGPNGKGKSTLLHLLVGNYQADGGSISRSNEVTIGFLNQDLLSYQTDDSILHVTMQAFARALEVEKELEHVIAAMETAYSDELLAKMTRLQEEYEALDGYTLQSKAEEILEGLGFKTEDLAKPLKLFSGGWRMRVMLAKLLLQKPSLLMLDEPTNHLDLPSIEWVENYLSNYEGAFIVVSHDRFFLDNVCTTIVEVNAEKFDVYSGNYSFFLEERALRREIQKNAFENQQAQIRQTERFIERFKAKASKARQVQSRVKSLERMEMVDDIIDENVRMHFKFNLSQASGKTVIELKNITKRFGDLTILDKANATIAKGDKIALIGANGRGKSTLLRIIKGMEPLQGGDRELGYNVIDSFYAQHQLESLNVDISVLEELKQAGTTKSEMELRTILGCFLFTGDDVFKKIKVLSGGEKSRVALAKTLISQANFLMLDEPTNHLDIQSVNILIQALQQYQGTYVVVSHDRYFVEAVANKIWYIEDCELKEYPGTYAEYEEWRAERAAAQAAAPKGTANKPAPKSNGNVNTAPKANSSDTAKLKKEISQVEGEIAELEALVQDAQERLSEPDVYNNAQILKQAQQSFDSCRQKLDAAMQRWQSLAEALEQV